MSSDSPGRFQNVTDANLKTNKPIDDVDVLKLFGNQQHNYELVTNTAAGENQIVHGHSHGDLYGSNQEGFTDYRPLWESSFISGTETGFAVAATASFSDSGIPIRLNAGPFRRFVTEVRYKVANASRGAKIRVERWDWVDSAAASDDGGGYGTNALQEATAAFTATTAKWRTVDGQRWDATTTTFSGLATKLCVLSGPTGITTLHEVNANAEIKIFVAASTSSTTTITISSITIHPAKTTDEGTGEIWS